VPLKLSISIADVRDARELVALGTAVAHDMTRQFGEGGWSATPGKDDVVGQVSASRVFIARRDAEVIGTVRLARAVPWAIDSSAFTPVAKALYVLGLAVAPDARGQGVGRRLMDAAKAAARSESAGALWLDAYEHVAGAGPFYLKCGFRQVGRTSYKQVPLIYYEWLTQDD
jgi:GNAT superfamily N-acetyltransferase